VTMWAALMKAICRFAGSCMLGFLAFRTLVVPS
jgi:hypothetical protein